MRGRRTTGALVLGAALAAALSFGLAAKLRPAAPPLGTQAALAASKVPYPMKFGPNQTYRAYCGLWRTDDGFDSTIQIKNELIVAPTDVTPVLYLRDGTEIDLPPVHIAAAGAVEVDVNEALAEHGGDYDKALERVGSAAIEYRYHSPGHVMASMRVLNLKKSLIFVYPFNPIMENKPGAHTLEAVWWRPDQDAKGFLALANATDHLEDARVSFMGSSGAPLPAASLALGPHEVQWLPLAPLLAELPLAQRGAGGVRIDYEGAIGSVIFAGGIADERTGFSAKMPYAEHDGADSADSAINVNMASPGVMVGRPMPGMGFPSELSFSPFLVLRNATDRVIPVDVKLNWMEGGSVKELSLPAEAFAPGEAREVGVAGFMAAHGLAGFDGDVNLYYSFQGRGGDVVGLAGSLDQSHNYVFEVPPQGATPSAGREAIDWRLEAGFDTMVSLWNWSPKAEDVVATFYYGDGSGKYELPLHLDAGASANLDLMQLAESNQLDKDGQPFSMSAGYGSATFETADGKHGWMNLAENVAVYNPVTATCGVSCVSCCGYSSVGIYPNPTDVAFQGQGYPQAEGEYCDGVEYPLTGSWSSSDTSIASFTNSATPLTGNGVGQANITIYLDGLPVNAGQVCNDVYPTCPPPYNTQVTGGANVAPTVNLSCPAGVLVVGTGPGAYDTSETCTASGTPAGGSYSWSINKNTATISANGSSATVTAAGQSVSANDTYIQVTYTLNGQSATVLDEITVRDPSGLAIVTDSGTEQDYNCQANGLGNYTCGDQRFIQYEVTDQLGAVQVAGIPVSEDLAPGVNTCAVTPTPRGGQTDSSGEVSQPDQLVLCTSACSTGVCPPPGSCQLAVTQKWYANGILVRTNSLVYGCKSITVNGG